MKKIFLYAYDHINLGDDLFIETIVKRYPNEQFYFWTDSKNKTVFQNLNNLKIIDQNSWKVNWLKRIRPSLVARYKDGIQKKCDVQVYIGGSIFMENPTWRDVVSWWEYQSTKYSFFVLGANFGPYHTEEYKNSMDKIFKQLKDVCFRDTYSKKLFENNKNVRQAPDILFSYPMPRVENKKKQIFVSVISCNNRSLNGLKEEEYIQKMANLIKEFQQLGYQIILASFCEEEGDLRAAESIKDNMKDGFNIRIMNYNGQNRDIFLKSIAESSYIIATRFHAMILGMVAGIPIFPIIYSDKTKNVLNDINFKGKSADLRKIESLTYENAQYNLKENYIVNIDDMKNNAEKHFYKLDLQLKNTKE